MAAAKEQRNGRPGTNCTGNITVAPGVYEECPYPAVAYGSRPGRQFCELHRTAGDVLFERGNPHDRRKEHAR